MRFLASPKPLSYRYFMGCRTTAAALSFIAAAATM